MADHAVRWWLACLSATLITGGAVGASIGSHPLRWGATTTPRWGASATPPRWASRAGLHGSWTGRPLGRSVPEVISIPRIRVRAQVIQLGLTPNGKAAVPPLRRPDVTSWFDRGPTPGQRGTAILYGHVDARKVRPAVFYRLGMLRPGNLIFVTLRDRQVAAFRVYKVALDPKSAFPAATVHMHTRRPTLRLVTCGGTFDRRTRHHLGNIVVFAAFAGARV
jgi:hypothetical protein